jgi:hypothetical protein
MGLNLHSAMGAFQNFLSIGIACMFAIQVLLSVAIGCICVASCDWNQESLDRDLGS